MTTVDLLAQSSSSAQAQPKWDAAGEEPEHSGQDLEKLPLLDKGGKGVAQGPDMWLHPRLWLQNLEEHFGSNLLILLFVVQHLSKGFGREITQRSELYLYGAFKVPAPRMQIYQSVTSLPWVIKPAIGLLSDMLPIGGLNKTPYMVFISVAGLAASCTIGLYGRLGVMSITVLVLCLTVFQLFFSTTDLLSEAKYAERMQERPMFGPDLMTYVWFGLNVGALIAVLASGAVIEYFGPQASYLIALLPVSAVLVSMLRGHLEEQAKSEELIAIERSRMVEQKEVIFLSILMFLGSCALTVVGISVGDPFVNCVASVSIAAVMLLSFSLLLSPVIAKVNAFFLIQTSLSFSISGATFYFFTDQDDRYPAMDGMLQGPHFSKFFYNSVMGTVGIVFSLVGVASYGRWMKTWTYRNLLIFTNIVHALLNLADMFIFTRYNLQVGIPDKAFVLGSSVLASVVDSWQWMPGVVILSFLCPKGMEATMYALLAGCHNLGSAVASSCGALLLDRLGCRPNGSLNETKQFEFLWLASLVSTILPLVTIMTLFWLIPNAYQNENLVPEGQNSATTGSAWNRWMKSGV